MGARVEMLGENARRILHRHGIAGEADHLGAEAQMKLVERRARENSSAIQRPSSKRGAA